MKKYDTLKRIGKQFGLGALAGGILGFCIAFIQGNLFSLSFSNEKLADSVAILTFVLASLLALVSLYYLYHVKKFYAAYKQSDEDDEDTYRALEKSNSYGMIYTGLSFVFIMVNFLVSYRFIIEDNGAQLRFPIFSLIFLIFIVYLQMNAIKWYNRIRDFKVPLLPTLKELRKNVLQLDEAELEANYKSAYDTVLNLSNQVIPTIYVVIFVINMLTQSINIVAVLAVAIIHLYIMLMQFKRVKAFYK